MSNAARAVLAMAAVTLFVVFALAAVHRVGPLRLISRWLDYARAAVYCCGIAAAAGVDEWLRMWNTCLARAQRER